MVISSIFCELFESRLEVEGLVLYSVAGSLFYYSSCGGMIITVGIWYLLFHFSRRKIESQSRALRTKRDSLEGCSSAWPRVYTRAITAGRRWKLNTNIDASSTTRPCVRLRRPASSCRTFQRDHCRFLRISWNRLRSLKTTAGLVTPRALSCVQATRDVPLRKV